MTKVFEDAIDQHVRNVIFYGKTADHKLYREGDYTTQVAVAELDDAFKKGACLVFDGTNYLVPVAFAAGKVITMSGTTSVTGTEWAAKAEE